MTHRRRDKSVKGQVTLEVGFALAAAFTLLLGAAIIFSYVNSRIVRREQAYEVGATGRVVAGASFFQGANPVNEAALPALNIRNDN